MVLQEGAQPPPAEGAVQSWCIKSSPSSPPTRCCSCQYQLPSEAAVLKAARRGWSQQRLQQAQPAADAAPAASSSSQSTAESVASPLQPPPPPAMPATPAGSGPLLLFPDTSALLPMLGAGANVSIPTFLTLDLLGQLAQQGRFGRSLPAHEQVCTLPVVPSVFSACRSTHLCCLCRLLQCPYTPSPLPVPRPCCSAPLHHSPPTHTTRRCSWW